MKPYCANCGVLAFLCFCFHLCKVSLELFSIALVAKWLNLTITIYSNILSIFSLLLLHLLLLFIFIHNLHIFNGHFSIVYRIATLLTDKKLKIFLFIAHEIRLFFTFKTDLKRRHIRNAKYIQLCIESGKIDFRRQIRFPWIIN